jgi:WD40 repeat protein
MDESESRLVKSLQDEVGLLQEQLARMTLERDKLEEECDVLALDNDRLRTEVNRLTRSQPATRKDKVVEVFSASSAAIVEDLDIFIDNSNEIFPVNHILKTISNANSGKNVICTAFLCQNPSEKSNDTEHLPDVLFTGGVDAYVKGYDYLTGIELYSFKGNAPVLCIDCYSHFAAIGMMDGSLMIIYLMSVDSTPHILFYKDHSKYVISVKWSNDGKYLATAGHDKVVNIYVNK